MRTAPALLIALTALAACSSNSSSSSGGSSSTAPTGSGGTCVAFGAAMGVGSGGAAATDPCPACMLSSCRAEYNAAFGSAIGVPGGACKGYWECVCACPSGASNCQGECAATTIDQACEDAQAAFGDCVDQKCAAACN